MLWVAVAFAVPVLGVVVLALMAWLLPVHQLNRRSWDLPQPPEQVWRVLTDFQAYPSWRQQVKTVMRVPSAPHQELWRESYGSHGLTWRTEVEDPGQVLLRHVVGNKLEFSGVWRFELIGLRHGGTRLNITEAAEYYRPLQRLKARFFTGQGRGVDRFLADLAREMQRQGPAPLARHALA